MKFHTIGFTKTSAESFFGRLRDAEVSTLVDTRLNRDSQLSGFAKGRDLEYFLSNLGGIKYRVEPLLVPTEQLLGDYRKRLISWAEYERKYRELIASRGAESIVRRDDFASSCLLCSEALPQHCHRRIAAEFLRDAFGGPDPIEVVHL